MQHLILESVANGMVEVMLAVQSCLIIVWTYLLMKHEGRRRTVLDQCLI